MQTYNARQASVAGVTGKLVSLDLDAQVAEPFPGAHPGILVDVQLAGAR